MIASVSPIIELIGIAAFGLSGWLIARRRCLDLYGATVLALVTALGGGTVRDIVLGIVPPTNLVSPIAIAVAAGPAVLLSIPRVRRLIRFPAVTGIKLAQVLLVADAIGLAAFTASGVATAAAISDSALLAVFCGVLTATGGGMIRDLLAGVVPAVLRREIYALASLVGAVVIVSLGALGTGMATALVVGMIVTTASRIGTYLLRISLPVPERCAKKHQEE